MTAETQLYHPYHIPTEIKCFRKQEQYQSRHGVRPSTLLKLSEHIKSKRYSLNLYRETAKERKPKRKIIPYASAFRPSIPTTTTTLSPILKQEPAPPPPPVKPIPEHQKVYYVSGLELLSWVSSKVDRLEVPAKQPPNIIKQESR